MGCVQATLTLIGNASNYISTLRRENIIKALPKSRENLVKILKQVSRQDSIGEGPHLFGDDAMDQVSKRITTSWVKGVITLGYRLESSNNPPTRLTCQIPSLSPAQAAVMDQEIQYQQRTGGGGQS